MPHGACIDDVQYMLSHVLLSNMHCLRDGKPSHTVVMVYCNNYSFIYVYIHAFCVDIAMGDMFLVVVKLKLVKVGKQTW